MKKLLLFFTLATTQLFAQRFGINAGLALSTYNAVGRTALPGYAKSDISTSGKTGVIVGAFLDVALSERLALRPGFSVVRKGAIENSTFTNNGTAYQFVERISFTSLDLPLNLLYKMKAGSGSFFSEVVWCRVFCRMAGSMDLILEQMFWQVTRSPMA
jgi:hypothetical protein